jgi:hypothetical protein
MQWNDSIKLPKSQERYAHSGTGDSRTPNRHHQIITLPQHAVIETLNTENKERIQNAEREKCQITYKGK